MTKKQLQGAIEAILFMSQKPIKTSKIFSVLAQDDLNIDSVKETLLTIQKEKEQENSGIYLAKVASAWQFRTKDDYAPYIKKLDTTKSLKLSSAAMEVLSIVAYNQPVTKVFVQDIRSVDSSHIFKQLLDKGFIRIDGRAKDVPGNPLTYSTTKFFLEFFGLNDLSDLPSLKETVDMVSTGAETDVKLDFINNLKDIKEINFPDNDILKEHDQVIKDLVKVLNNG